MSEDLAKAARAAMLLWEMDPKRQALAKILNIPAGQVTDEMIRQVCAGPGNRGLNIQQIPRTRKKIT